MLMVDHPLPHFGERENGKTPRYIVLHYTDTLNLEQTVNMLNDSKVSSHYCIDIDGTVLKFVDEDKRAWHAGNSYWQGEDDINSASIGIEIQNTGHTYGHKIFPPKQMAAAEALTKEIMERHGIPAENVIGHSDVAPHRKEDPGHLFPWQELARKGISVWPRANKDHIEKARRLIDKERRLMRLFKKIGFAPVNTFDTDCPTFEDVIEAFQRHYEPELFTSPHADMKVGKLSVKTVALALALSEVI